MPLRPLFVYGTLRDADVLALVLGRAVGAGQLRPAEAPGHALVFFPGRTYPAIRQAAGETAVGTLIEGLGAADLVALDAFEGEEYRRGGIELIVSGQALSADVYWPATPVEAGVAWRLEEWAERHKDEYFAAEASNILQWRERLAALRRPS